jgi:hypothetical protein
MPRIAVLSDALCADNRPLLRRVRRFCAEHREMFHYELDDFARIGAALATIARVGPAVLVVNGGDRVVQAALTELYRGAAFGVQLPPIAILPSDKKSLIHLNFGGGADPIVALERVLDIVRRGVAPNVVPRQLIALSHGFEGERPVLGMFLGGAGLADTILFCRRRLYPLGLPVGLCHALTIGAVLLSSLFGRRLSGGRKGDGAVVTVLRNGEPQGRFALVMVTTLERLLLKTRLPASGAKLGALRLLLVESRPLPMLRAFAAMLMGRLGRSRLSGVHLESGDEVRIEADGSAVLLDGELFEASRGRPIVLRSTPAVPFLSLAA